MPACMSGKSGMSGRPPARARHTNAFPRPTWLFPCRAHVGHVGRARLHGESCGADGKDMGRMRPVGGMERRAPRRAAFPLAAGFAGILCGLWPPCGAGMAKKSSRLTFIGVRGRLFKPECPEHLSLWAFLSGKPLFLAPPRHVLFV